MKDIRAGAISASARDGRGNGVRRRTISFARRKAANVSWYRLGGPERAGLSFRLKTLNIVRVV